MWAAHFILRIRSGDGSIRTMAEQKETAPTAQNLTITTTAEDRAVIAEIEQLAGGSSKTEIVRRALRIYQANLLEQAAKLTELRRAAGGSS